MSTESRIYDESYIAGGDLSAKQHRFVKYSAANTVVICGAAEAAVGVLQNDPLQNRAAEVRHLGISLLEVNGNSVNIAAGDRLESAADGVGVKSTADKKYVGAVALQAATADGVKISVQLLGIAQQSSL